jgi:CO dehydrogenase maturation factor
MWGKYSSRVEKLQLGKDRNERLGLMTNYQAYLAGKRIGVVGKGGSGKSTLTILLARELRIRGYEVCILDADSTNIGLHQALVIPDPPSSLIDYFGGMVFSGGSVTCPVDDPTPLRGAEILLDQLPHEYAARNPEGIILLSAGKIGDLGPGAGCDGPINKIARDFSLVAEGSSLVTLVDFKAGFEDAARGAITGLDWVLVVVDPTNAAIQMAIHMEAMVNQMKAGKPPATEHLEDPELVKMARSIFRESKIRGVMVILNKVRDEEMEKYLRTKLDAAGVKVIGAIDEDPSITITWLRGTRLEGKTLRRETEQVIDALEALEQRE